MLLYGPNVEACIEKHPTSDNLAPSPDLAMESDRYVSHETAITNPKYSSNVATFKGNVSQFLNSCATFIFQPLRETARMLGRGCIV